MVMKGFAGVVAFLLVVALGGLSCAHIGIRRERPTLPAAEQVLALKAEADRPVRLRWINTASQSGPVGAIVHSVFVFEWRDGRVLLVDTGMDGEAAIAFGRPAEWLLGSDPTVVGRSVDEALGSARERLVGLVFTHLHSDHTQGIEHLCPSGAAPFDAYMTRAQFERPNYTTRIGLAPIEKAPCVRRAPIADEGLVRIPGQAGVGVIRVAGHTPGSQVVVAWVGDDEPRGYVLAGDAVFEFDQIPEDRPKPLAYRLLITPEADTQLAPVRRWLHALSRDHGLVVLPSHDLAHLEAIGLPAFEAEE